ncbi:transposable element Tcb1 transposase [Trichonephila clavipes]|nr:transposable element Tcb1 transposase [Trichonephila clavipes]
MSRRKQRSAFDQVSEFDRGKIVAYRDCGLSFSEIGSRVGRNQTTVMWIFEPWRRMWVAEWNDVFFTDESHICHQYHDDRIRVWRHHGERMQNNCVMHCNTGPVSGIMVWVGIGYDSRTSLVRIAFT